tara:strand:+ start:6606 stop:7331 length:726 start_codon:yes stop_codon:yes gene_type:complete
MPYTTEERNQLTTYKAFVSNLRDDYVRKIKESVPNNFRDEENVLQSFEDIDTGEGLERTDLKKNIYQDILSEINDASTDDFFDNINLSQTTLQAEKQKKYVKSELLENTINSQFNELFTVEDSELPPPIEEERDDRGDLINPRLEVNEGDIISFTTEQSIRIWRIENGKKREFITTNDFYSSRFYLQQVKEIPKDLLDQIDTGNLIVLETQADFIEEEVLPRDFIAAPYTTLDDQGYGGSL